MPSLIPGYEYDIFISYRQKDNKYDGWVTEFVENLKKELEATFKEEVSVYFDINPSDYLLETYDVDASLKDKLRCLVFIPIVSRTYCDPKSFAWEREFKAFVEQASKDQFGLKVKLPNGNVASRILPVRIYDLNAADINLCEEVLGGVLRGVEFIYKAPGVNRPLRSREENPHDNLNHTIYRDQVNKVANAIEEIILGLSEPERPVAEKTIPREPLEQRLKDGKTHVHKKTAGRPGWKIITGSIAAVILLLLAGILVYPRLFKKSARAITEKSVAIMSFKNLTGDTANNYLAVMNHEALYQELARISQVKPLRVVGSRTVSIIEKNRMTLSKVPREASVDYLIDGSILSTGSVEELMISMTHVFPDERVVWANNYSSDRKNILRLHNTIAEQIAQKIGLDLLPEDKVKLPQTVMVNPASYEAYSRGMSEIEKSTRAGMTKGLEYLHEAVRIAPGDAFANAGLSLGYLSIAHSALDPGDALIRGEEFALKAMKLDSTIAEVHAALAIAYLYKSWKFAESEKHFKRALELNPNLDMAHYHYSWGLYLWGRMDEAIIEHKLAQKYDPYNPLHTAWLGGLYNFAGRYEEAISEAFKSLEIQKDYPVGYLVLGNTYLNMGRNEEAIKMHQKLVEVAPHWQNALCLTYIKTGHLEEANKILAEIEKSEITPRNALYRANIYAALGIKDEAFKWLNYEPHAATTAWAAVGDNYKSLHDDPRWDEFLNRLNLPNK